MKAILKNNEEKDVLNGFSWIYSNEVEKLKGTLNETMDVEVYDSKLNFIGIGYINYNSKILIRMLTNKKEALDSAFFEKRILNSINHRKNLGIYNACRLIFSEGDNLPGLIVDKYEDYLVISFETLGMEKRKDLIISLLQKLIKPLGIIERSCSPSRRKEGLEDIQRFIGNEFTYVTIKENDIQYRVDIVNGQKTGHFFDQRYNRLLLRQYVENKTVLDLCCNTGGFSLNALKAKAKKVTSVDISEKALESYKENILLNNFEDSDIEIVEDDVFNFLDEQIEKNNQFDCVVLDPPAFVKSNDQLTSAYNGYVNANAKALKVVKSGGYLFTFSCSGLLTLDLFIQMIKESSIKSKRNVKLINFNIQSPDHPVDLVKLQNLYLKFCILKVE